MASNLNEFARKNPGVVAAMAMKREKRPKKKSTGSKKDEAMSVAAARRLAKLKGGKNGSDSNQ